MTLEKMERLVDVYKAFNNLKGKHLESYFRPDLNGPITYIFYIGIYDMFEVYTDKDKFSSLKISQEEAEALIKQGECKREVGTMDGKRKIITLYKIK